MQKHCSVVSQVDLETLPIFSSNEAIFQLSFCSVAGIPLVFHSHTLGDKWTVSWQLKAGSDAMWIPIFHNSSADKNVKYIIASWAYVEEILFSVDSQISSQTESNTWYSSTK